MDYTFNRCNRRCQSLDRPLRPGEVYYSVVEEAGDELRRYAISGEAWQGPPETATAWWRQTMPDADQPKQVPTPPAVLVDVLRQTADDPSRAAMRYLLALHLVRKRVVEMVDRTPDDPAGTVMLRTDEGETMSVPTVVIADRGEAQRLGEALQQWLLSDQAEMD